MAVWVVGTVLLVVALTPLMRTLEDMPRADVTFVNRSRWDIDVELLLDRGHSRVGLATMRANTTVKVEEIGEPGGDSWTFEFAVWGHTARVTVPDDELRANRFRVVVPEALRRELEDANTPPSAYR